MPRAIGVLAPEHIKDWAGMLAMGLIKGDDMAQAVAIPPPAPLQGAMAAAFARLQ